MAMAVGKKVIDDLDVILVVDASLVGEAIHREFRVFAQVAADFDSAAAGSTKVKGGLKF